MFLEILGGRGIFALGGWDDLEIQKRCISHGILYADSMENVCISALKGRLRMYPLS